MDLKKIIVFIAIIFSTFLFLYSRNVEPKKLLVNSHNIYTKNWTISQNGFKAVVVSDLHIGSYHVDLKKLNQVVNIVNSQNPDVIFLLGDLDANLIFLSEISQDEISQSLSRLKAACGVFAVMGNHDYEPKNIVRPILKKAKITLLEDKSKEIFYKNKKIRICGIKDLWHYTSDVKYVIGNVNCPTIFLSHNPDTFPNVPEEVSLTLSGHTHSGEIVLPFLGAIWVPSKYGKRYAKGHIQEGNKQLFVTSGIGTLSRHRLFNPPEIVILNIYKAE